MKKKIYRYGLALLAVSPMLVASCVEDTVPYSSTVLTDQVQQSPIAAEGSLGGVPSYLTSNVFGDRRDWDFGMGSLIHLRDCMTEDMAHYPSDYNQFSWAGTASYFTRDYIYPQYTWNFQTKAVSTTNLVLASVDTTSASNLQKGYYAVASTFRAMYYIDMMGEYEWMPSDVTPVGESPEGNNIEGLTVPIVTESTSESVAANNPRATREEMTKFIESDLKVAEKWIDFYEGTEKNMPHKDVVYGLFARLYLWVGDYANAEKYARLAITAPHNNVAVMTEAEAMNTSTGFNDAEANHWMLAVLQSKESLINNLRAWTAFVANDAAYGYTNVMKGASPIMIDANMYKRMRDTDWRKKMYKAPKTSALVGQDVWIDAELGEAMPDYSSTKYRPGQGDGTTWNIGSVTDIPLMRIEEMYFIEAEAAAHQDAGRGKQLLETFMKTYRDKQYSCSASSTDDVVEEIVFQKRVELWGEGRSFFDIKRLNLSTTRGYEGTNHIEDERYNTEGRANWMSWQIVLTEENSNKALKGYNNPASNSAAYKLWVPAE